MVPLADRIIHILEAMDPDSELDYSAAIRKIISSCKDNLGDDTLASIKDICCQDLSDEAITSTLSGMQSEDIASLYDDIVDVLDDAGVDYIDPLYDEDECDDDDKKKE